MSQKNPVWYRRVSRIPRENRKPVSIVLPVYNEGAMLQLTVLSILHNTEYQPYEILICDQGSTDGCCDFLKWPGFRRYKNLRYLDCSDSPGANATRNIGMGHANGAYLIVLDAHMAVEPGWIERFIEGYSSFEDVALLGANIPDINNWIRRKKKYVYGIRDLSLINAQPEAVDLIDGIYAESPCIPGGTTFTTKKYIELCGGFDGGMIGRGWTDVEFSMRAWLYGYRCIMITDLYIMHYYKQAGQGTYKTVKKNREYNRLRYVLTNFQTQVNRQKIFDHAGRSKEFLDAYDDLASDEDFLLWKDQQQSNFLRNDSWWISYFSHYHDGCFD